MFFKHIIRRFFAIPLLVSSCIIAHAQSMTKVMDSIMAIKNIEVMLEQSINLMNKGIKNNNEITTACGSSMTGLAYMLSKNTDSCLFYLNNAISIAEKNFSKDTALCKKILSQSYNYMALYYMNFNTDWSYKTIDYLYKALEKIDKDSTDYPVILTNLTLSYYLRRDTSGMQYAKACHDYSRRHGTSRFMSNYCMALMNYLTGDYENSSKFADESITIINDTKNKSLFQREMIMACGIKAMAMLKMDKEKEALSALQYTETINSTDVSITEAYICLADYYLDKNEYEKAVSILFEEADRVNKRQSYAGKSLVYEKISDIYAGKGNFDKAYAYHKICDSLNRMIFDMNKEYAIAEVKAKYNLAQYQNKLQEQKIILLKRNRLNTILVIALIFSSVIIYIILINKTKKDRYYKKIVQQYAEKASLNKHIKELEDIHGAQPNKYATSALSDTKGDNIYKAMVSQMEDAEIWRDSELTIEKLAKILNTNRSYLSRLINERAGVNFNQYLCKYRVEGAISSIINSDGECLLKSLAFESGFKTASGFYKAFSRETGMPPSAFRDRYAKCKN